MYLLLSITLAVAGGDDSRLVFQNLPWCLFYSQCLRCLTGHCIPLSFHVFHRKVIFSPFCIDHGRLLGV